MDKCAYHTKTRAVATCVACKRAVCATCRDEGDRGICAQCLVPQAHSKAESLPAAQPQTSKGPKPFSRLPQNSGAPERAAPSSSPLGREAGKKSPGPPPAGNQPSEIAYRAQPEGQPLPRKAPDSTERARRNDIVYCSNHREIRATGPCKLCGRPFCPACVNTSATCGRCARNNADALRQAFPTDYEDSSAGFTSWLGKVARVGVASLLLGGLGWGGWRLLHPVPTARVAVLPPEDAPKQSTLSDADRAFLAKLKREQRVAMAEASGESRKGLPRTHQPAQDTRGHAAAPAAVSGPVFIHAIAPADGAIVGGQTFIRASLSGAPTRVVCEVDGVVLGVTSGVTPVFSWDTRKAGNGPHIITLTASGPAGGSSSTFTLNVMNR